MNNIQKKVERIVQQNQKSNESKRSELSAPEAQRLEYEQTIKPRFTESEKNFVEKYFQKLSPIGYKEQDVYQFIKRHEWNEKAVEEVSNEKLKTSKDNSNGDGWTEIKRTEKPQTAKNDRNFKDGQRYKKNVRTAEQGERTGDGSNYQDQKPYYKNRQQDRRRENEPGQDNQGQDQEYQDNRNYNQNRRGGGDYQNRRNNNQYTRRNNYNQEPREGERNQETREDAQPRKTEQEENVTERKESYNQERRNNYNQDKRPAEKRNYQKQKSGNSPLYAKKNQSQTQFEYVRKEVAQPKEPEQPNKQSEPQQTHQHEQPKPSAPQEKKTKADLLKINEPQPTPVDSRATEIKHKEEKKESAHPVKSHETPVKSHKEPAHETHKQTTSTHPVKTHETPVKTHKEPAHEAHKPTTSAHPTKTHETPVKSHKEVAHEVQKQPVASHQEAPSKKQEAPKHAEPIVNQSQPQPTQNTSIPQQQPHFGGPIIMPPMPQMMNQQAGPGFLLPQTVDVKPLFPYPYTVFPLPNGSCHIIPLYLMMPPMMPMFPPQFPTAQPPQTTQGNQAPNASQISQHQMSSFFSFPENGQRKTA